ncbi:MAG: hypothetical protein Q4G25_02130 [Paracoccus sp. (in: a-proteobacteria)]|nr:hypothetical protein [Paracoccus sp. (in: a-proteobacteria)]
MAEMKRLCALGLVGLAVALVIWGLLAGADPGAARAERRDDARMSDLRTLNSNVLCQIRADDDRRLPEGPAVTDACPGPLPEGDPQSGAAYRYQRLDGRTWQICADFERADRTPSGAGYVTDATRFDAESGCLISTWGWPADGGTPPRGLPGAEAGDGSVTSPDADTDAD